MANAAQQMPEHVGTAYKDAVDNIIFLKRQQWLATNYALLVYAAIFVISAHLAYLQLLRLLSTGACCTYFNARSRGLEIAWVGFTGPTSAQRSVLDWMYRRNQDHIGIHRRFTLASWLSHSWELS